MDVFETLKKNITETGRIAAEKAKILKDILVVREQIRTNKKEIRTLTYKIGQTYLDLHGDDCEDAFTDFIRGIKEAQEEMAEKEATLEELKTQIKAADIVDIDEEDDMDEFFEEMEADEEVAKAVDEAADESEEAVTKDEAETLAEEEKTEHAAEVTEEVEKVEDVAAEEVTE